MEITLIILMLIVSGLGAFIGVLFAHLIKDKMTLEERIGGYQPKKLDNNVTIQKPPKRK